MITTADIIKRCDHHAEKADAAGQFETANTLYMAARELERLQREKGTTQ